MTVTPTLFTILVLVAFVLAIAANYSKRPIFLLSIAVVLLSMSFLLGHLRIA